MRTSRLLQIVVFTFMTAFTYSAFGQDEEGPATLLPDIDPQDIEIRGEFDVRFQGLSRQPILGFSPTPPVYRVDPDRMPFLESDEEVVASVPLSDLEPALKPEQNFIQFAEQQNIYSRLGAGSYMSPELKFISEMPISEQESMAIDMGHHSSEGDRDFSSFRDFNGEIQWTRRSGEHHWGLGVNGASTFNYSPLSDPGLVSVADPQKAKRLSEYQFGVEGRWQMLESAFNGWQSRAKLQYFSKEGEELSGGNKLNIDETFYSIDLNRFWEGSQIEQVFGIQARAAGSWYNTRPDDSQYWLTNSIGARYRHLFGYSHQIEARLNFYQLSDPVNDSDLYLYPDIRYRYQGTNRYTVVLQVRGFVKDPSLANIHRENRFNLQHNLDVQHDRGLHIRMHTDVQIRSHTKLYSGLDYWQYYNKGYYSSLSNPASIFFEQHYAEDATHVEWYNGITQNLSALRTKASFELGFNFTSVNEDVIPSGEIPYVPDWRGRAHVMFNPVERLDISGWMDMVGDRSTFQDGENVNGFVQLGFRSDIRITENFGAYFKALNILDQDYEIWQNYNERPLQLYGGLTLHW